MQQQVPEPNPDFPPASLYQHLQMLQLQQQQQQQQMAQISSSGGILCGIPPGTSVPVCHSTMPGTSVNAFMTNVHGTSMQGPGCVSPPTFVVDCQPPVAFNRTSPPLNYQNLCIIREVAGDSAEKLPVDDDARFVTCDVSTDKSQEKSDFERFRQKFTNPRISITDAHGHVMPVLHHNADEEEMITDDVSPFNYQPEFYSNCQLPGNKTNHSYEEALRSALPLANFLDGVDLPGEIFANYTATSSSFSNASTAGSVENAAYRHAQGESEYQSTDALCNRLNYSGPTLALTRRTMSYVFREMTRVLDAFSSELVYRYSGNRFLLQNATVSLEIEVCQGDPEQTLKFRKLAGDDCQYNRVCNQLLSCLAL